MYDLLIKNGILIDGTGRPMFRADIGVREGEILAIGDLVHERGEKEIDAMGKYVAPGFIDVNNHADTYWQIFKNPYQESLLYQGVTTVIGGNSGSSLAPLVNPQTIRSIQKWTDVQKINFNWLTMAEYLAEVSRKGLGVNFATLVGHGTLRRGTLQERNYGIIFGCQVRENYPITIFGLPFERGYQIGSFRNSQNQSLHLVGVSGRVTAFSFQEPFFRKEIQFVFGLKASAGAYVLRNGSDVVYGVLPTHNRGLFLTTSKDTRVGLVEERVIRAGIRTRMIVFEGSF
jgi:hypothetical protein